MLVDVAIPEMALDELTYTTERELMPGSRVIVEVQTSFHAGIVVGPSLHEVPNPKPIAGVIDECTKLDPDLWDLAKWSASVCMCGINASLRTILPKNFWMGEELNAPTLSSHNSQHFREIDNFLPFEPQRVSFYLDELRKPGRTLMLLPSRSAAEEFYVRLPYELRHEAVLWRSLGEWDTWKAIHAKNFRIVIGSAGAVFAPLSPERIIVENEASENYFLPYGLRISARSLAGRRAAFLGSTLILGGYLPSLKTFMRVHPAITLKPERNDIIIADMYSSRKEQASGIDGQIPLTFSLIRRTYRALTNGRNVLWILSRKGNSSEVFCPKCGHVMLCPKCGNLMRSLNDGEILKCRVCGELKPLPPKCPECGHEELRGRWPGIEALANIVSMYYPKVKLYVEGSDRARMRGLILAGHKGLELLNTLRPALVAWLDIDAELSYGDYDTRYRVYANLYRSLYAGVKSSGERKLLIQARREGRKLCGYLAQGWEKFLNEELNARSEFDMPPSKYMIELDCGGKISREEIIDTLEDNGFFVMDSGEDNHPLYVNVEALDEIAELLKPYRRVLKITVRSE